MKIEAEEVIKRYQIIVSNLTNNNILLDLKAKALEKELEDMKKDEKLPSKEEL